MVRKYYAEHRDKLIAYSKQYAVEHRDEIAERMKTYNKLYREAHKEELEAKEALYRAEHQDEQKTYNKQYRSEHSEELKAAARQRYKKRPKEYNQNYYLKNRDLMLEQRRVKTLRTYGLTVDAYDDMLAAQDGVCAVCGQPPQKLRLAVDHDHDTGQVRALLCGECNRALGCIHDDPARLRALADYLDRYTDTEENKERQA
jgi:hypothetical protein